MKNGSCPKCNKTEVYREKGAMHGSEFVTLKDAVIFPKSTLPDKFVCISCGYLEYYVLSKEDLEFIQKNWEKVPNKD